ncbi:hypothetical protein D3C72_1465590 [compost metagenome]
MSRKIGGRRAGRTSIRIFARTGLEGQQSQLILLQSERRADGQTNRIWASCPVLNIQRGPPHEDQSRHPGRFGRRPAGRLQPRRRQGGCARRRCRRERSGRAEGSGRRLCHGPDPRLAAVVDRSQHDFQLHGALQQVRRQDHAGPGQPGQQRGRGQHRPGLGRRQLSGRLHRHPRGLGLQELERGHRQEQELPERRRLPADHLQVDQGRADRSAHGQGDGRPDLPGRDQAGDAGRYLQR